MMAYACMYGAMSNQLDDISSAESLGYDGIDPYSEYVDSVSRLFESKDYEQVLVMSQNALDNAPESETSWIEEAYLDKIGALINLGRYEECLSSFLPLYVAISTLSYGDSNEELSAKLPIYACEDYDYSSTFRYIAHKAPLAVEKSLCEFSASLPEDSLAVGRIAVLNSLILEWMDRGHYSKSLSLVDEYEYMCRMCENEYFPKSLPRLNLYLHAYEYDKIDKLYHGLSDDEKKSIDINIVMSLAKARAEDIDAAIDFVDPELDGREISDLQIILFSISGRYDDAEELVDMFLDFSDVEKALFGDFSYEYSLRKGIIQCLRGDKEAAKATFSIYFDNLELDPFSAALAYAYLGEKETSMQLAVKAGDKIPLTNLAGLYSALGESRKALEILGKLFECGRMHPDYLKTDINLNGLLRHPDFPVVAARYRRDNPNALE